MIVFEMPFMSLQEIFHVLESPIAFQRESEQ